MPLSVCRCCGGPIEAEQLRRGPNPNICPSCEQLLADDSPTVMAEIAGLESKENFDELLDQPANAAPPKGQPVNAPPAIEPKESRK